MQLLLYVSDLAWRAVLQLLLTCRLLGVHGRQCLGGSGLIVCVHQLETLLCMLSVTCRTWGFKLDFAST